MNIGITSISPNEGVLIIPLQKKLIDADIEKIIKDFPLELNLLKEDFQGNAGDYLVTYSKNIKLIFLGLGDQLTFHKVLRSFRSLSKKGQHLLSSKVYLSLIHGSIDAKGAKLIEAAANGLMLGTYEIGRYKSDETSGHPFKAETSSLELLSEAAGNIVEAAKRGIAFATTQMSILDLVNAPSNKKLPQDLANWALKSGENQQFKVEVFDKAKITELGMGGLLAVNQGSIHPPTFTIMDYQPKGQEVLKTIGLVGKGVTFDTGGLSIKTSAGMPLMKSDMGGAAAVLGTVEMAAKLNLPFRIIGIVPSTDNCVGSDAFKPSDVIGSYSGKTIEIIDTDAEGRLILADGLAYMNKHYKADILIDLATLTGSAVRTLGYHAAALFSKNEVLRKGIFDAGLAIGERTWPLPLWDDYQEELQSDVADIKNLGTKPMSGAITAAKFLEFFTGAHPAWAHLDIAGVAFAETEFSKHKSATAFGIRLLIEYFESLIEV